VRTSDVADPRARERESERERANARAREGEMCGPVMLPMRRQAEKMAAPSSQLFFFVFFFITLKHRVE